jgi:hypothetical protein
MKANELRIGNLVIDRKGQICKVERIEKEFEECKILSNTALTHLPVEPIPLTEEILVNWCGFKKGILFDTILYLSNANWHISLKDSVYQLNYKENPKNQWIPVCINLKHVHQLQNLYFALTGEELTINHPSAK